MNNKSWLGILEHEVSKASKQLDDALRANWPEGSRIQVMLSEAQKNPSNGTVQSVRNGYVVVRLDTINRRRNQTVKHVWWRKVVAPW